MNTLKNNMTTKEITYKEVLDLLMQMKNQKTNWTDVADAITVYGSSRWEKGYELGKEHGTLLGELK
jgi:hypothetical protein